MSYCTKCGAELGETAKFCAYCGQAVNEPVVIQSTQKTFKFDFKAILEKVKELYNKVAPKVIPFVKKYFKIIIAVVVALVILIVGISIYNAKHCSLSSCKNASVSGSKYCYTHKCNICKQPKTYNSDYCYLHKTLYDGGGSGTSTGSVYSDLKFTNIRVQHNSLYTVVTGTVTNYGSRSYRFVTIKGAFKSSSGTVLDTDSTYAVGSEGLSKGESKTFRMSISKNYSVSKCDISIISYK